MSIASIRVGDIVDVNHKGRRFYAIVKDKVGRKLDIRPLDRNVNYFTATGHDVVGIYRKAKGSV
jgi:hypothetical protein